MTKGTVEYSSNNSGGNWWLTDEDWRALEAAGWEVQWYKDQYNKWFPTGKDGRWLGALASSAKKFNTTLRQAIEDWESITGANSTALGCSCCGTPHAFSFEGEDGSYDYYTPDYPRYGERL